MTKTMELSLGVPLLKGENLACVAWGNHTISNPCHTINRVDTGHPHKILICGTAEEVQQIVDAVNHHDEMVEKLHDTATALAEVLLLHNAAMTPSEWAARHRVAEEAIKMLDKVRGSAVAKE